MIGASSALVNVNFDLGLPWADFLISARQLHVDGFSVKDISAASPERAMELVRDIVLAYRPELEGCTVAAFSMHGGMRYSICVAHPSLPRVKFDDLAPVMSLDPRWVIDKDGMWMEAGDRPIVKEVVDDPTGSAERQA